MKIHVIKFGDKYLAETYKASFITRSYWRESTIPLTININEALHFETASKAKNTLRLMENKLEAIKKESEEATKDAKNWSVHYATRKLKNTIPLIDSIKNAIVECEEVEDTNFRNDINKRIKYNKYISEHSKYSVEFRTDSSRTCKCCGLVLKKIPFINFYHGNGFKICVFCISNLQNDIPVMKAKIGQERYDEIEREIFIHKV